MPSFTKLTFTLKVTVVFSLLAAGITASEYLNYRRQKALLHQNRAKEVAAIADLKARQIGIWFAERLNEARSQRDRPIWEDIRTLLEPGRATQDVHKRGLSWLNSFRVMGYADVALLDARGKVRLASMPDTRSIGPAAEALAARAIATSEVVASELYYTAVNHIGLDIFVPLGGDAATAPRGVLLLRVDPADFLFPFIQRWPAPSDSAESLLVRRDGNDVVFLNELRHRKGTTLALRLPLTRTVLSRVRTAPASEAAEATDYREVAVMAAARTVPGTAWIVISKIDLREINAPLLQIAWTNAGLVLLLLAGCGAAAALLWQQQRRADAQLLQASAYNRTLIEASLDPLVTIDAAGKITDVNAATEKITGQTRQELIGSDFCDYFTDPQKARAGYMQVFRDGTVQDYALEVRHREGGQTPVLYNASVYRDAAGRIAGVAAAARDITQRKRAEEALKRAQEQLRVATAAGSIGLWYWDIPNDDLYWSDECKALFGVPEMQDLTYGSFESLLHPEDVAATNAKVRQAIADHAEYYAEYRIVWLDGSMHWIAARGRASYGEDGTPQSLTGAAQDITERKRAEERLRQQAALLDLAHDAIMVQDPTNRIVFWSRGAEATYGWSAAEAIGCVTPELLHTGFPAPLESIMADLNERGTWEGELHHTTRAGTRIIAASRWSLERDQAGAVRTILEINRDITARKEAEQALARAGAYNRSLIEATLDPLVTIAPDGKITDVNRATEQATGYSRAELIGADFSDYFTDPQRARSGYQQAFREGHVKDYELVIHRRDGQLIPVLYNASLYRDDTGQVAGVVAAARDITERKRAEAALAEKAAELARSNSDLEQFAYVASHDLQEPLRMIANYTGLLAERYQEKLDSDARDFIAYAVDGATRMQTLIDDLLSFSRVGTRGQAFKQVDSTDALDRALRNLQLAIADSGASVIYDKLPTVIGDASQLIQLFQNLIGNAIKFRGTAPPRICISAQRDANEWRFAVSDNGIGIEPEYCDRIFAIFQRLHSREEYPGTGIGLAVCRRIVDRHGGRIWVESQPGSGSTFVFTLPDAPRASAPPALQSRRQREEPLITERITA